MSMSLKIQVAIIDFGMGNLFSIKRACEHAGLRAVITCDSTDLLKSDAVILPGVGAFGDAMESIESLDLVNPIKEFINTGKPFMGICLGMQLLLTESKEFGVYKGLDVISGSVERFLPKNNTGKKVKVPQTGWNRLAKPAEKNNSWNNSPLEGIEEGVFMYFVHSYYVVPKSQECILSYTDYEGVQYCSSLKQKNIFACQFHPERSSIQGLKIYENWAKEVGDARQ